MIIKKEFDLTNYNTYRIKAIAKSVYIVENLSDFKIMSDSYRDSLFIIGGGSNLILSKDYYKDVNFALLGDRFSSITIKNNYVKVQAGATLKEIAEKAFDNELGGMEHLYDIPGSVGGAIYMNAGVTERAISDILVDVTWFDREKRELVTEKKENLTWGYRKSEFQHKNKIIVEATLSLPSQNKYEIRKKIDTVVEKRHCKQPWDMPSAGSVFKRPKGRYVGQMIEELGLKGKIIGGMQISEKHAGFIVNIGLGTGQDVIALVEFVKERVKARYNVDLELEQVVV